ncbi:ATP-dependent helicase HrpB [Maribrevibacterium harenarium]|uniref:ATP-dependent helicase HrpB n=1 Tax=Maribrevibacterium harenarium TaxID=2589817 RepID=A0A501WE77_9GAMM|nr:ATP-dependent helicase HrpB [Maribrevibacterium harenarium]TPE46710.1 ATP-dependent helicase HrpB [Maribrevibacterium harenarium]
MTTAFPIFDVLPQVLEHLQQHHNCLLEAAPGAGKTTVLPLALLQENWLGNSKIIMLEPRRIAAKSAALRLAEQLGEPLGQTVGYQIRHEGKQSIHTRILVVTEGILTRMLQEDPSLDGVAMVIFDEFHERNLHSDLALSLCLQARSLFREDDPLKLLVMSATLDSERLQELLQTHPIRSAGRQFPVDIRYQNKALTQAEVIRYLPALIMKAYSEEQGSILVFLPGQREIRQVMQELDKAALGDNTLVMSLSGELSTAEQQAVLRPAPSGKRKIVLATSVAQTSLTIEGIRIVIDSGLSRESRFDAKTATARLHTRSASQAESIQRAGRAGRLEPGVCYRWWSQEQQARLAPQHQPQIELDDLSSLVLELANWGVGQPAELDWVTPPSTALWQQSRELLQSLGLLQIGEQLALTPTGEKAVAMPLPPRLSSILLQGSVHCQGDALLDLVCALSMDTRSLSGDSDLEHMLATLPTHRELRHTWQSTRKRLFNYLPKQENSSAAILDVALFGFSDRIALRQRQEGNNVFYKLSNGRIAQLPATDSNSRHDMLIAIEVGGHSQQQYDRIYRSIPTTLARLQAINPEIVKNQFICDWCSRSGRLLGETKAMIGKLTVESKPLATLPDNAVEQATCRYLRKEGLGLLNWGDAARQLQQRILFANQQIGQDFPCITDTWLMEHLEQWLAPFLAGVTSLTQLKKLDLHEALLAILSWEQQQLLQQQVPTHIKIASGNRAPLHYQAGEVVLRAKLQELFGEQTSPVIAGKAIKIELLSPAQRPLAVTQDLPFFWREVYPQVRKEMRGRYPKHPWPEDPMTAIATSKTNRALRQQD